MQKNPVSPLALGAAGVAVLLSACATTQPAPDATTQALYRAENSIRVAEQDQAASFAAFELTSARGKLAAAQQAAAQDDDKTARARAEEAQADAELARAKADLSQSLNQANQAQRPLNLDDSIQTMPAPGAR